MKNPIKTDASICPSCHMGKEFNMCSNGFHVVTTPHPSSDVEIASNQYASKNTLTGSEWNTAKSAFKAGWQASFQSGGVGKTFQECNIESLEAQNAWIEAGNNPDGYSKAVFEAMRLFAQSHQVKEGEGWVHVDTSLPETGRMIIICEWDVPESVNMVFEDYLSNHVYTHWMYAPELPPSPTTK